MGRHACADAESQMQCHRCKSDIEQSGAGVIEIRPIAQYGIICRKKYVGPAGGLRLNAQRKGPRGINSMILGMVPC
jgi:hypothetical protein